MKTSELTGAALNRAVAKALGKLPATYDDWTQTWPHYSTDWSQGGPIIEREEIDVLMEQQDLKTWAAEIYHSPKAYIRQRGHTPLIAAMRCFVASKLGNDVEVPKELENV
jgi:hypothetical protein